ncbi:hypothetical protein [Chitinimonas lacunae]|uniref:Uncharacterized protein n=1 Tax=Chitinimonas lacunae TaxID=1963018 RepID=A0ABV8MTP3_9NEIS
MSGQTNRPRRKDQTLDAPMHHCGARGGGDWRNREMQNKGKYSAKYLQGSMLKNKENKYLLFPVYPIIRLMTNGPAQ